MIIITGFNRANFFTYRLKPCSLTKWEIILRIQRTHHLFWNKTSDEESKHVWVKQMIPSVWLFMCGYLLKKFLKKFIKNFNLKIQINIKPIENIELIEPIKVEPNEIKTEQIETTGDFLIFICLIKILNV